MPPLVVIAGATATGKTALSLELAEVIDGAEIVSADSRQIFRGLDIGTAKPDRAQQSRSPHHGLDLADPDERFTTADYQRAATAALCGIAERGGVALLVGGTGLYLRAVARGLPLDHGDADPALRARLEERLAGEGLERLVAELTELDAAARSGVDLRNPRRVVRALERALLTGHALPPPPRGYPAAVTWIGLRRESAEHRAAIAARVEEQFAAGLLDEATALLDRYPDDLPAFSAMGYREAFAVLHGRMDRQAAMAEDARRTWAYARRQRTWFRSEPDIRWFSTGPVTLAETTAHLARFVGSRPTGVYAGGR